MQDQHQNQNVIHSRQPNLQIQSANIEKMLLEDQDEDGNWLSKEFNRIPFVLYKFWLILNFIGAFVSECLLIWASYKIYQTNKIRIGQILIIYFHVSLMLLVYACGEMLFAIVRRKSSAAQKSYLKFQYLLVAALICVASFLILLEERKLIVAYPYITYVIISSIIHLLGCHAVLKVFRKNHPLLRRQAHSGDPEVSDPLLTDFHEQNEVILSEISKYDEKLNSWPCLIYNWWLKLAVVFEILVIFGSIFSLITSQLFQGTFSLTLFLSIGALLLSLFNTYSRFEMESTMRTRALARSKRAVFLLKLSIVSSIVSYLFVAMYVDLEQLQSIKIIIPSLGNFAFFAAIPIVCLAGALKVHEFIEKREPFVKASSYNSELYL